MKTFRMIGMALFAVLMCVNFTSCSSDDDDETQEEFSIVGTWKMIQGDMDEWTIIFRENGTARDSWSDEGYSDEYELTYRFDSKTLILYTKVPGEDQLEWKVKINKKDEITIQYTFINEGDGKEHTQIYVFRKQ